jgi:hypothetical protein
MSSTFVSSEVHKRKQEIKVDAEAVTEVKVISCQLKKIK